MSDDRRPFGDDDPTQVHRPTPQAEAGYEPTRMQESVTAFDDRAPASSVLVEERVQPGRRPFPLAALVTTALVAMLLGLGLGYVLFHDRTEAPSPVTVTTLPPLSVETSTTTSSSTTTTTESQSSTTTRQQTTTTIRQTTTTTRPTTTTTQPPVTTASVNEVPSLRRAFPVPTTSPS